MKIKLLLLFVFSVNSIIHSQTDLIWSDEVNCGINFNFSPQYFPKVSVENNTIEVISTTITNYVNKLQKIEYSMDGEILNIQYYGNGNGNSLSQSVEDYVIDNSGNLYLLMTIDYEEPIVVIQKYDSYANLIWEEEIESIEYSQINNTDIEILNDNQLFIIYDEHETYTGEEKHLITSYSDTGTFLWQLDLQEIEFFTSNITVYNNNVIVFGFNEYPYHSMITIEPNGTKTVVENIEFNSGLHNIFVDDNLDIFATHDSLYKLTKLNNEGEIIWATYYSGGQGVGLKRITKFIKDEEGNIFITGHISGGETQHPDDTRLDFLTLKLNPNGEIIWENRYHRSIDSGEEPYDLVLKNGYIYVCGETSSNGIGTPHDFVVLKMNASTGDETTQYKYDNNGLDDCFFSMVVFDNDEIVLSGFSLENYPNNAKLITQKLSGVTGLLSISESNKNVISIFPNPINNDEFLKIQNNQFSKYSILTINGIEIQNGDLNIGGNSEIHLNNYSIGIYLLVLKSDSTTIIKKLLVK